MLQLKQEEVFIFNIKILNSIKFTLYETCSQILFKKCSTGRLRWGKCNLYIKPCLNIFKTVKNDLKN